MKFLLQDCFGDHLGFVLGDRRGRKVAAHGIFHDLIVFAATKQDSDAAVFMRALVVPVKRFKVESQLAHMFGFEADSLRLMSYLTPDKKPIGYSLDRTMAEHGYNRDKLPRLGHIPHSKAGIPLLALKFMGRKSVALQTEGLGKQAFHGRIVILVNEHSTGAAEMLAQLALENRFATIVGSHTPGRLVSRSGVKFEKGYTLILPVAAYMSWSGTGCRSRRTGRLRPRLRLPSAPSGRPMDVAGRPAALQRLLLHSLRCAACGREIS